MMSVIISERLLLIKALTEVEAKYTPYMISNTGNVYYEIFRKKPGYVKYVRLPDIGLYVYSDHSYAINKFNVKRMIVSKMGRLYTKYECVKISSGAGSVVLVGSNYCHDFNHNSGIEV